MLPLLGEAQQTTMKASMKERQAFKKAGTKIEAAAKAEAAKQRY